MSSIVIALDPATGAMTSLRVKAGDWEVLSGPGNVVARQQDRGDLWELYKGPGRRQPRRDDDPAKRAQARSGRL